MFGNDQIIKSNQLSLTLVKSFLSSQATKIWYWDFFCYVNKINETFPKLRSRNMKCSVTKPIDGKLVILQTVSTIINGIYSTLSNGKWFSLEKSQKKLLESQKLWRNWPHFTTCARLATAFFPWNTRNTKESPFANSFPLQTLKKSWRVVKTFNSLGNTRFVIFVYVPNPQIWFTELKSMSSQANYSPIFRQNK